MADESERPGIAPHPQSRGRMLWGRYRLGRSERFASHRNMERLLEPDGAFLDHGAARKTPEATEKASFVSEKVERPSPIGKLAGGPRQWARATSRPGGLGGPGRVLER